VDRTGSRASKKMDKTMIKPTQSPTKFGEKTTLKKMNKKAMSLERGSR
jgi:hypothetical protein